MAEPKTYIVVLKNGETHLAADLKGTVEPADVLMAFGWDRVLFMQVVPPDEALLEVLKYAQQN